MNILHKLKAVFALLAGVSVGVGAMLPGTLSKAPAPLHEISVATPTQMAVIKVGAQRMSAVEKMRSLENERALARNAAAPRG